MKCPWMPVQKTIYFPHAKEQVVITDFADCYKGECPFYSPARKISENLSTCEH